MELKKILNYLNIESTSTSLVKGMSTSSKKIEKGYIFIALKGMIDNGNNYIDEAKKNGAIYILSDDINSDYYIPSLKEKIIPLFLYFYNITSYPKLIGITGTNGKTSLARVIYSSLKELNYNVKVISSLGGEGVIESKLTTPSYEELINIILSNLDLDYLIIECSSIGIKEGRLSSLIFEYLFLTNLEEDHLDYHLNLKNYWNTKINFLINQGKVVFIDKNLSKLFLSTPKKGKIVFYSSKYQKIDFSLLHSVFIYENEKYTSKIIGLGNVKNLMQLISFLKYLNVSQSKIKSIVENIKLINGRMEVISTSPLVILDYAHTASSLKNAYESIVQLTKKKIVTIIGAGGNRQKEKRKEYGRLAFKYSNRVILTSDNPRNENPYDICLDIISSNKGKYEIIIERKKAIEHALKTIKEDEILLIEGKGEEKTIEISGRIIAHSDKKEVLRILNEL